MRILDLIKNNLTGTLIIVTFLIWIAWDIYAYNTEGSKTISVIITDFSWYSPLLPFILGNLTGHWLWPAHGRHEIE